MKKKNITLLFLFMSISLYTQDIKKEIPTKLKKVLTHYLNKKETEKYNAAVFLIENMSIHKSVDYKWFDKNKVEVPFSEFNFSDYKLAYQYLFNLIDSINLRPKKIVTFDQDIITSEFLIKNIDAAYSQWKNNPWSKGYSFDTFCEYILPYRSLIEPIEDWREDYEILGSRRKYQIDDKNDPVSICTQIISSLDDFTFINKRPDPIPILSPKQILFRKQGSCPDLANFALYVSRSVGLAVTFDFTPQYAASSNRHFWNTIIDNDGNYIPFNSNAVNDSDESLPYIYNANRKRLGKVFRKTYSIQKNSLANLIAPKSIPNSFLKDKNNLDVTSQYVDVSNLEIDATKFNDTIAYINVFNLGKWKLIDWGKKEKGKMVFKNLGRDLVYLPSTFNSRKTSYQKHPFLITKKGIVKELIPSRERLVSIKLSRYNERKSNYIDFNTLEIIDNENYTLYFWMNEWNSLGTSSATEGSLTFKDVPSNALFRLLPEKPDRFERIFTIENKTNKIYWY
jgi:hypothetical protein